MWHDVAALSEPLVALFTLLLVVATLLLWKSTRDLAISSLKSSEAQLRAYVFAEPTDINLDGQLVEVTYVVRNAGLTPARTVRCMQVFLIAPHPLPAGVTVKYELETVLGGGIANLAPGATMKHSAMTDVAGGKSLPENVTNDNSRLYLFAQFIYADVFGRQHKTNFCASVPQVAEDIIRKRRRKREKLHYDYADHHNDFD